MCTALAGNPEFGYFDTANMTNWNHGLDWMHALESESFDGDLGGQPVCKPDGLCIQEHQRFESQI